MLVYSAYFANTRSNADATSEALELVYKLLQRSSDEEKQRNGWEFIAKGSKFVNVFSTRCPFVNDTVGLMIDKEIFDRLDELWIVLMKGHSPEPFSDQCTAASSEEKIKNMKQRFRGTPSFSTEPSSTSWLSPTRTPEYFKIMDELAKVHPHSLSANDSYMQIMRQMVDFHMRHLGHALRYHNDHYLSDQIILQDVMNDIVNFETNCPKGRSAAQNHLLCLMTLGTTIERHKTSARGDNDLVKVESWAHIHEFILQTFDIPQGILIGMGYNVWIADEGARYSEKERRYACHSALKDFITTMTETQSGSGGQLHNITAWNVPLLFGDGRQPPELDVWNGEEPMWMQDDHAKGQSVPSGSGAAPPEGPQPPPQTDTNIQPKKMPRPQQSGSASSSGYAAFRSGHGSASGSADHEKDENWIPNVDWMKKTRPSRVKVVIYAAEDYAQVEQRIAFLKADRSFVISTIEGPHSTREFASNLQWKQYMRRMTFHAALTYNICTEGQLDSQMLNANDFEWLKLYHYISTTTELVRCKGYPVTEVLAMLTLGIEQTVRGDIRQNLKRLNNQIGQYIVKKPWSAWIGMNLGDR